MPMNRQDWNGQAEEIHSKMYRGYGQKIEVEGIADALSQAYKSGVEDSLKVLEEMAHCGCPECGGRGWYAQQVSDTEEEQRRCEYCNDGVVEVDEVMLKPTIEAIRQLVNEEK